MKKILIFLLSFSLLQTHAQVFQRIVLPSAAPSGFDSALVSLPNGYAASTTSYPLLVFCPGKGEAADGSSAGTGLNKIINSQGSGGPIWFIAQGKFPSSFLNSKDGKSYQFIVVAAQENDWGNSPQSLSLILPAILSKYRVDPTRVYLTGPSAGGQGLSQYAGHFVSAPTVPVAGIVPMSPAIDGSDIANVAKNIAADGVHIWVFGDPNNDLWGGNGQIMEQAVAKINPALAQFTSFNTGHGPWNPFYDPALAPMNIYSWMLQFTSSGITTGPVVTPPVTPPVTAPPATTPPTGPRKPMRWVMSPNQDSGWIMTAPPYLPDDTLDFPARYNWTYKELANYSGVYGHPLIITNSGGTTRGNNGITFTNCTYVHLTGTGTPGVTYGFYLTNPTPTLRSQSPFAVSIYGRCKGIEIDHVDMHNVGIGYHVETDNNCDQSLDYPNWKIDSITIHDGRVVGIWNEGLYLGDTSPDNANYDHRADQCSVAQATPTYSLPMKLGYVNIYNMLIDSTGRGGIQAAAQYVYIHNNFIKHNGLNGDDAQGTGISVGLYTTGLIDSNTVTNTLTVGIASIGGGFTNKRIRITNNHIDSCGYLFCYPRLATTADETFDPGKELAFVNPFDWGCPVWMATRPRVYTTDNPAGTAVKGQDSTLFSITGNTFGRYIRSTASDQDHSAIQIEDDFPGMQVNGDSICNNVSSLDQPINIYTGRVLHPINIVQCGVVVPPPPAVPPTVSAGFNQTVTLPIPGVNLVGSVTAGDTAKVTQTWGQVSGPNTATITNGGQTAAIASGLVAGSYVFRLTATSKNGLSASATATVVVNPAPAPVCPTCPTCPVIPAARTVTGIQITINGLLITIPLAGTKITYSDGTTQ